METNKRPLLLAIDLQQGWLHKTATEAAMLKAADLCRHFKGDVIHCCFRNDPDSLFYSQLNWTRFSDEVDTAVIPEVADLNLPKYWRSTYNCVNEETLPIIKQASHVYIVGVFTDVSVAATAMGIFDQNVPVSVVVDCVATLHGQDVHEASLKSLDSGIGSNNLVYAAAIA